MSAAVRWLGSICPNLANATDRPGDVLPCTDPGSAILTLPPMEALEPGLLTLFKIVGTLVLSIGLIPLVFLMVEGDRSEPGGYNDKK